jgi:enoyl-CoA hydratase/carnithine racemase
VEVVDGLEHLSGTDDVGAVVLTGAGGVLVAGTDIGEMVDMGPSDHPLAIGADAPLTTALAHERRLFERLFDSHDQKEGMRALLDKRKPRFEGR